MRGISRRVQTSSRGKAGRRGAVPYQYVRSRDDVRYGCFLIVGATIGRPPYTNIAPWQAGRRGRRPLRFVRPRDDTTNLAFPLGGRRGHSNLRLHWWMRGISPRVQTSHHAKNGRRNASRTMINFYTSSAAISKAYCSISFRSENGTLPPRTSWYFSCPLPARSTISPSPACSAT